MHTSDTDMCRCQIEVINLVLALWCNRRKTWCRCLIMNANGRSKFCWFFSAFCTCLAFLDDCISSALLFWGVGKETRWIFAVLPVRSQHAHINSFLVSTLKLLFVFVLKSLVRSKLWAFSNLRQRAHSITPVIWWAGPAFFSVTKAESTG